MQRLSEQTPEPGYELLADMARGHELAQLLFTAVEFHIFSLLTEPKTPEQVAGILKTDPVVTAKFMHALAAAGLLEYNNGRYQNTPVCETFLVEGKASYRGNLLKLLGKQYTIWSSMGKLLKNGVRQQPASERFEDRFNEGFTLAMAESALMGSLQKTVSILKNLPQFAGAKKMLDLGGGPALYAIALAQEKADLEVIVFDLPQIVETANRFIERYKMAGRVKTMAGDFTRDHLGAGYDLVLASHCLYRHHDTVTTVLGKVFQSLNPGGTLVLTQMLLDEDGTAPLGVLLFDLKLFFMGSPHHVYTRNEFRNILLQVGFSRIEFIEAAGGDRAFTVICGQKETAAAGTSETFRKHYRMADSPDEV